MRVVNVAVGCPRSSVASEVEIATAIVEARAKCAGPGRAQSVGLVLARVLDLVLDY
jgi:hypothetical protein